MRSWKRHEDPLPCALLHLVVAFVALTCMSCSTSSPDWSANTDPPATAEEIARWRSERGFVEASGAEIKQAGRWQRRFSKNSAASPDGTLRLVLRTGELIGDFQHGASTTSAYQLTDAAGRVLISAPSRVHDDRTAVEEDIGASVLAWFPADGSKVLVYEYLKGGNGPPPLAILFFQDAENQGKWFVRFPDLGETLNKPYDEGDHAECRGLSGEEILIRNTREGVSKIHIDRLKDRHPFPFTIG